MVFAVTNAALAPINAERARCDAVTVTSGETNSVGSYPSPGWRVFEILKRGAPALVQHHDLRYPAVITPLISLSNFMRIACAKSA